MYKRQVQIFNILSSVAGDLGVTVITSTHDRTVMELASRVVEMSDGSVVASGEESELLSFTKRRHTGVYRRQMVPVASETATVRLHGEDAAEAVDVPEPAVDEPSGPSLPEEDGGDVARWARPGR